MEFFENGWQDASLVVLILLGLAALLWIGSLIWVYNDAKKRGLSQVISLLITALVGFTAWPLTVVGWIILRPKHQDQIHA